MSLVVPPEVVQVIATLGAEAVGALFKLFSEDGREAVVEAMDRNGTALDAAPEVLTVVTAQIEAARSRVRAHTQARAETARARYRLVDTTRTVLASLALSPALSGEERHEVAVAEAVVRAALDGDLEVVPRDRSLLAPVLPIAIFGDE